MILFQCDRCGKIEAGRQPIIEGKVCAQEPSGWLALSVPDGEYNACSKPCADRISEMLGGHAQFTEDESE